MFDEGARAGACCSRIPWIALTPRDVHVCNTLYLDGSVALRLSFAKGRPLAAVAVVQAADGCCRAGAGQQKSTNAATDGNGRWRPWRVGEQAP